MHQLNKLNCELFCFLDDGPLKSILLDRYLDEPDSLCDIMDFDFEGSLLIKNSSDGSTPAVILRLECDDFLYQTTLDIADLNIHQRAELQQLIEQHSPEQQAVASTTNKNIVRKKHAADLLNIAQASQALGLSQRTMKELIPCNDMRIDDNGSSKSIAEYYWDKQLIEHLILLRKQQQQGRPYRSDDINFIAENCCEGDSKWAQVTIATYLKHCQ